MRGRFPFRSLIEQGWRLSGSSDVWIGSEREATNPFFSIWCCMRRQTYAGLTIDEDESLDFDTALRMHTIDAAAVLGRSEEHTSELQSLMRISYAVFCLKKKNKNKQ